MRTQNRATSPISGVTTLDLRQFVLQHRYRVTFYAVAAWLLVLIFANPTAVRDGGITVLENVKSALLFTRDGDDADGSWPMDKVIDAIEGDDGEVKLIAVEELGRKRGAAARLALLAVVEAEQDPILLRTAVRSLIAHRDAADESFIAGYVAKHLQELDPLFVVAMFQATGQWMFDAMEKIRSEHTDPRVRQLADWAIHHRAEISNQASLWQ